MTLQRTEPQALPTSSWKPRLVEVVASAAAVCTIGALGLNWFGAHLAFLGEPVVIDEEEIRNYRTLLVVLAVSVVLSLVAASWRGARRAWTWHLTVAGVAVVAALVFSLSPEPTASDPDPVTPEVEQPAAPPCHSGGDSSECVGG